MTDQQQQTSGTTQQTQTSAAPWYGEVPPEVKTWVDGKQYASPQAALEAHMNAEKLLGVPADQIVRLPKADDAAAWEGVWSKLGRPEKAEDYGLPVPEGDDGEFAKVASAVFHKAGVPKGMAAQIATAINEHVAGAMKARADAMQAQASQALDALKQEWGADFPKREELARRAFREYGQKAGLEEGDVTALESAIGTSKMLRLFTALGESMSEHAFAGGESGSQSFSVSPASARAKVDEARQQRIENKISERDYLAIVDKFGPIAARAA